MENKKGSLVTVFLVIAIILIIVMGTFMYMQKTEADRQIAELGNHISELQEKGDSISNTTNDDNFILEKNDEEEVAEKEIKEILIPSGFSGSSLIRVVLCSDNTVYVINYDGAGYEENNIVKRTLIAKNVDTIEYNGQGKEFQSIIVKGEKLEVIETPYNWIEFKDLGKVSKQFDAKFYEVQEISKEYRYYENVKNYKDFIYDLDGDGINDKITLSHTIEKTENGIGGYNEEDIYPVKLNGETFDVGTSMDSIYIVDLNEDDKNIEIVIFDDGASDDPHYTIYSKIGNKMVELKGINGYPLKCDKKGTVLVKDNYNGVTVPEIYFDYYKLQDNIVEMKNVVIENIKDIELKTSHLYFSKDKQDFIEIFDVLEKNNQNIEKTLKQLGIEQLNDNTTFKIISVTPEDNERDEYKIYVELSDGRKGYIYHIQWAG